MLLFLQICASALAVFGFYFLLKTISGYFLASREIYAAVVIRKQQDCDNLDLLLGEASLSLFAAKSRRLLVVVDTELGEQEREAVYKTATSFGAEILSVDKKIYQKGKDSL